MPSKGRRPSTPSAIRIRNARPSDAAKLTEIEEAVFAADRISRRRFAVLAVRPSACVLAAQQNRVIVGYAIVLTRRGIRSARLYSLAVAPEAAGRGIGRRLLGAAEKAAVRRRALRLHLEVRADNPNAVKLYEATGYRRTGQRLDYYKDGMTALIYSRDLSAARAAPIRRAA